MKCTPETRWKYLRENNVKFYNQDRNTTLKEYLKAIFPGVAFEYNYRIKKTELPEGVEYRRYQLDAIARDLKLVVEFDGVNHYMDTQVCINDIKKDRWLRDLGYKVVRIPYWIQLSNEVIWELFEIDVKDEFCQLDYSFYCPEDNTVNYNILPGNMCEMGRNRFVHEYNHFSEDVRINVINDLLACAETAISQYSEDIIDAIMPYSIYECMDIPDIWPQYSDELEELLFGEPFNLFKYAAGFRSFDDIDADTVHLAHHYSWVSRDEDSIDAETAEWFLTEHPSFTAWGASIFDVNREENLIHINGVELNRCPSKEELRGLQELAHRLNKPLHTQCFHNDNETYFSANTLRIHDIPDAECTK